MKTDIHKTVLDSLIGAYGQIRIGDPLNEETLMGPLIDHAAIEAMENSINKGIQQGGRQRCMENLHGASDELH
ncbi:MAG: aldehyde dehydrogenase family protein [Desulfobacteraceae bacterium]|jgi:aldehyde dehydrogenase (NAD+)